MQMVLLGPPGVGKGTQGRRLASDRGWALISTGEILRDAIARHTRPEAATPSARPAFEGRHASHGRFLIVAGADGDGACLIEPAVVCTHCGFCQSFGH